MILIGCANAYDEPSEQVMYLSALPALTNAACCLTSDSDQLDEAFDMVANSSIVKGLGNTLTASLITVACSFHPGCACRNGVLIWCTTRLYCIRMIIELISGA